MLFSYTSVRSLIRWITGYYKMNCNRTVFKSQLFSSSDVTVYSANNPGFPQPGECEKSYVKKAKWERFCNWTRYHIKGKRPRNSLGCTGQVKVRIFCRIQKNIKHHQKKSVSRVSSEGEIMRSLKYLRNCFHYVIIAGAQSSRLEIGTFVVFHRGIVGTVLFLLYKRDAGRHSNIFKFTMHAYETSMF